MSKAALQMTGRAPAADVNLAPRALPIFVMWSSTDEGPSATPYPTPVPQPPFGRGTKLRRQPRVPLRSA